MKVKLCVVLFLGALAVATQAMAVSPAGNPFLSVDINGANVTTPGVGPLQAGFQPFEIIVNTNALSADFNNPGNWAKAATVGITKTFSTSEGDVTALITGFSPGGGYSARNRTNEDALVPAPSLLSLDRDFIFSPAVNDVGWGRGWVKTQLSGPGVLPNQAYRIAVYHRDINFVGATQTNGYQADTDLAALGGLDGPAAWLDANTATTGLAVGAGYNSTETAPAGYKNPIPTLARSRNGGPNFYGSPFVYASAFRTYADATGKVTVYTWADGDSFDGNNVQRAPVLNGFELAKVPEPSSIALFAIALGGLAVLRRKTR